MENREKTYFLLEMILFFGVLPKVICVNCTSLHLLATKISLFEDLTFMVPFLVSNYTNKSRFKRKISSKC